MFFFTIVRNNIDNVWFTTSVCLSVWGWQVDEKKSCVPNLANNVFQK